MSEVATRCASMLAELIEFNTVNPGGDEPAICRYLAEALRKRGADDVEVGTVERPGQLGAWVFARFGTPRLLVNAHVDTVPENRGWTRDPHVPEITDSRVYGLGACDTKGAIAAILTALEEHQPRDVGILFSGDEENGSTVLPRFLATPAARTAQMAIVCEPTRRRAGVRHRGVLSFQADVVGQGGHSSKADDLSKPIVTMARLALELDSLGASVRVEGPDDMKGLCLMVARLVGGVAFNVVPEKARLTWSIRHPPGFDVAALEARQQAIARSVDDSIIITKVLDQAPFELASPNRLRPLLADHATSWCPLDFWTEAAVFSTHGIEAVVIGPGDIGQAHAADEYVTLDDLAWATAMFERVFQSSRHGS